MVSRRVLGCYVRVNYCAEADGVKSEELVIIFELLVCAVGLLFRSTVAVVVSYIKLLGTKC